MGGWILKPGAQIDGISPLYFCSEFMAEYKESLFWNFVNRTKSLRPLTLTDKGMLPGD